MAPGTEVQTSMFFRGQAAVLRLSETNNSAGLFCGVVVHVCCLSGPGREDATKHANNLSFDAVKLNAAQCVFGVNKFQK